MKNSSARHGAIKLSSEEEKQIVKMKETAELFPHREGEAPPDQHHGVLSGVHAIFVRVVNAEEEWAQYQLWLWRETEQPGLDEVQALAAVFFGGKGFQILPDANDPRQVRVLGLFLPIVD